LYLKPAHRLPKERIKISEQKIFHRSAAGLGAVNGYIEETVTGQKVIKVFCHEEQ